MNAKLYWTIEHLKRGVYDMQFDIRCWWLSQQADFLGWRRRLDALMPQPQPAPASTMARERARYALHSV